jgi:hypothetical protein
MLILHLLFKNPETCPGQARLFAQARKYFWGYPIVWSPDSHNILIGDGPNAVRGINLDNGASTDFEKMVDPLPSFSYNYAWSPDNRYVAFTGKWYERQTNGSSRSIPFSRVIPLDRNDSKSEMDGIVDQREKSYFHSWIKLLTFQPGRKYTVTPIARDLALRDKPSLDGKILKPLQPKDTVTLIDGPVNADYCIWWKMKVGDVEGWAQGIKFWFDAAK